MSVTNKQSATLNNVASSATSVALFAASTGGGKRRYLYNDSSSAVNIAFTATAASTTNFSVRVAANTGFDFPSPTYLGPCSAIWDTANGFARTTEW